MFPCLEVFRQAHISFSFEAGRSWKPTKMQLKIALNSSFLHLRTGCGEGDSGANVLEGLNLHMIGALSLPRSVWGAGRTPHHFSHSETVWSSSLGLHGKIFHQKNPEPESCTEEKLFLHCDAEHHLQSPHRCSADHNTQLSTADESNVPQY